MLTYIYKRAKNFTLMIESYKDQYNKTTILKSYYEYLFKNYKQLEKIQIEKFIRTINYFELPDFRILDLYRKLISFESKDFSSASLIIYSIAKIKLNEEVKKELNKSKKEEIDKILKDCYNTIKDEDKFYIAEKKSTIPLIWAISEINIYDEVVFNAMNSYVIKNIDNFNEYVRLIRLITINY